jgi:hypothetical protein
MATGRVPTTANSPLTAKGDLFGYSTAPARLAVGNDGEQIVADSSTSTGLRYTGNYAAGKNAIINGAFNVWQRGTSFTMTNSTTYCADRWRTYRDGSGATLTVSRQTFTPGTAPVAGYETMYFLRFNQSVAGTGGTYSAFTTPIEEVTSFAGQTITISFWAKADASRTVQVAVNQNFGSGGSGGVSTYGTNFTLTTSWVRYSTTIAVPSISGKTIGTGSYLDVQFLPANNTAQVLDFWGVQAEAGSVATAFQTATGTIQGELAACQRYYERINATSIYAGFGSGFCNNTTTGQIFVNYQTTKRTQPSGAVSAAGDFLVTITGDNKTVSGVSFDQFANNGVYMSFTVTGLTAGQGCVVRSNNKTTSYIELSSEL